MKKKSSQRASRRPSASRRAAWIDCVDALNGHCTNITALAGLLEASGHECEHLRLELVANAASLILREMEQVREWVNKVHQGKIKP